METRRGFVRTLLAAGAFLLLPARRAWAKKLALRLDKVPKLSAVGGWMVVKLKGKPVLLVRDGKDSVRALSAVCTHEACTVGFDPEARQVACKCHASRFDLTGKVLTGPATTPLPAYETRLEPERVVVTLD